MTASGLAGSSDVLTQLQHLACTVSCCLQAAHPRTARPQSVSMDSLCFMQSVFLRLLIGMGHH